MRAVLFTHMLPSFLLRAFFVSFLCAPVIPQVCGVVVVFSLCLQCILWNVCVSLQKMKEEADEDRLKYSHEYDDQFKRVRFPAHFVFTPYQPFILGTVNLCFAIPISDS